jgi:uncharacterized membrane protein
VGAGTPIRSEPTTAGFPVSAAVRSRARRARWQPRLFDYLYVSFTNSIAFSPTDSMPLTHAAKGLMLTEASISSMTVLLVVARSVNIFT